MTDGRRTASLLALGVAALGCAWALARFVTFAEPACAHTFRDDAFYTFAWGRSLAAGAGPVVSAGTTTSGVQPLWGLLLVPCAWLAGPAALPLAAHVLGLLCHVLTAVLWATVAPRGLARWTVGLLYLGNPFLLVEAQNGQETALACLLLALAWRARSGPAVRLAVLSLLLVFARSDLWGVVVALWLVRDGMRGLAVPALVLAAHLGWNRWLGTGFLPDSALPIPWLHGLARAALGESGWVRETWWQLRPLLLGNAWTAVGFVPVGLAAAALARPMVPRMLSRWGFLLVVAAALAGAADLEAAAVATVALALWPRAASRTVARDLAALAAGLGAMLFLHYVLRAHPRDYYLAPVGALAMVGLLRFRRLPLVLLAAALAQAAHVAVHRGEPLGSQREMHWCGVHADRFVPAGEPLACFNSGIVTWYRAGKVHNLDGVVDGRAFAALRAGALGSHLDQLAVRFVADHAVQFSLDPELPHACGRFLGEGFSPARDLRELVRFDDRRGDAGRPGTAAFSIWWRTGRGPEPVPLVAADLGLQPDGSRLVCWPARRGEVLVAEQADGSRRVLVVSDADTAWVIPVRPDELGTGRLLAGDGAAPVLVLAR